MSKHSLSLRFHVEHPRTWTYVKLLTRTHMHRQAHTGTHKRTDRHRQAQTQTQNRTDKRQETRECSHDGRDRESVEVRGVCAGGACGALVRRVASETNHTPTATARPHPNGHTPPRPKKKVTCTTHPREHDEAGSLAPNQASQTNPAPDPPSPKNNEYSEDPTRRTPKLQKKKKCSDAVDIHEGQQKQLGFKS